MTHTEIADKLDAYNRWRRGDDEDLKQPDPADLGRTLDAAVSALRASEAPATQHIAHKIEAIGYTMQAIAERVRYYAGFNPERREWATKLETAGAIVQGWGLSWCTKCGGKMAPGVAIGQTATGSPDELGGYVVTVSPAGPGKLIDCLKCSGCGHSVSV